MSRDIEYKEITKPLAISPETGNGMEIGRFTTALGDEWAVTFGNDFLYRIGSNDTNWEYRPLAFAGDGSGTIFFPWVVNEEEKSKTMSIMAKHGVPFMRELR